MSDTAGHSANAAPTIDAQNSPEASTGSAPPERPDEPVPTNERNLAGWTGALFFAFCVGYSGWHLFTLNVAPLETWTFRILHVGGALALGFGLTTAIAAASGPARTHETGARALIGVVAAIAAWTGVGWALLVVGAAVTSLWAGFDAPPQWMFDSFGPALAGGAMLAVATAWFVEPSRDRISALDWALIGAAVAGCAFILYSLDALNLRLRAGTPFSDPQNGWAAFTISLLIVELTRRVAGLALVVITLVFIGYAFLGPWLPGFLEHRGYDAQRFFTYIFTDNGVLGPTTAVSSTYIILFIIFAAFLQTSRVGDYFVNFAFAAAGWARGGPAKVSIFASGMMGMINGTSAGNVVATGALTIPLMKKVGYRPRSAAAFEAAASTGGQIMPPIMGAGAFIMAEITGIAYTELVIAALIPAVLYFASIFFMVDFEASRTDMRGLSRDELPRVGALLRQAYLFLPIAILIGALFLGYSVIRAGTLATVSAIVVSWLTPYRMGLRGIIDTLALGARMSIQIIAVCACAGLIVGVISLTGVGARFSALLLDLAAQSKLLALVFAMVISIILGMGMPTTAAYAVAASVVAPGLIEIGITPLVAHFFIFYFAVLSAITPPVALAAYAGAAIAGSEPMR
ncbi:MAG: TRAP transporter fused permease subunit, partial [Pseudomonadota bacterium]